MDPDVALDDIREAVAEFEELSEDNFVDALRLADTIVDRFKGLDDWLSRDGFLPADWQAEEDKPQCTVEHGDWTGPHVRISSCPAGA
jgi:hypothetical protein